MIKENKIKTPLISIIVLNWNGKRFIEPFMESVRQQKLDGFHLEVLFTDNSSSDNSVQYYKDNYLDNKLFKLVQNAGNYGYAKGNNLGMVHAKGEYILVCNNDLVLDEGLVSELYSTMLQVDADLVVPKLMFLNRPGYINNAGSILDPEKNWPIYEIGFNEKDVNQYPVVREISAFCGACVLFKRSFLETVGLYDDKFFMYFEDGDLSWRGQKAGKKYYYSPRAIANHVHTGTSKEGSPLFSHFVARNRLLILTKNAGPRIILSGWKVTLKENFVVRIRNIAKALLGSYPKKTAMVEFYRSTKMIFAAMLLTPYCLLKRWGVIKERTL